MANYEHDVLDGGISLKFEALEAGLSRVYRWRGESAGQNKGLKRRCITLVLVDLKQGLNHTGTTKPIMLKTINQGPFWTLLKMLILKINMHVVHIPFKPECCMSLCGVCQAAGVLFYPSFLLPTEKNLTEVKSVTVIHIGNAMCCTCRNSQCPVH